MGQYAMRDFAGTSAMDHFTIDTEFDDFTSKVDWDDRSGFMYALNESASAWRSRKHSDWLDVDA